MLSLYSGMQKFWLKSLLMRGVKQVEDESLGCWYDAQLKEKYWPRASKPLDANCNGFFCSVLPVVLTCSSRLRSEPWNSKNKVGVTG